MKISEIFEQAKKENRAVLTIFITCGDPNIDFSEKLVEQICNSGADIVELGVPFSDPMADGPVVQAACLRALDAKTTLPQIIAMAKRLRERGIDKPFILSSYFNPILKYGIEKTVDACVDANIEALIALDLPYEESDEIASVAEPKGLKFIQFVAPATPLERVEKISQKDAGFLYYATVEKIQTQDGKLDSKIAQRLADVRKASKLPVASGFEIATEELAHASALESDSVVIASKIVDIAYGTFEEKGEAPALEAVDVFVKKLANAMKR